VVLASLLVPMIGKAYKTAQRARMQADLQLIANALDAYKLDQRDYPRNPTDGGPTGFSLNGGRFFFVGLLGH